VLITEAPVSVADEFAHRRRRYLITMIIRALCIVGAASTFRFSGWLAAGFVVGAMVLPWCAVLIANDRPPKRELQFRRFLPQHHSVAPELPPAHEPLAPAEPPGDEGRRDRSRDPRIIDL